MNYDPDKPTDMQTAIFWAYHIENPCVDPVTGKNIRDFYIREAEQTVLPKLKDDYAVAFLRKVIDMYRK
ncbi:hypothetical protein D6764_01235 [Candidatus Woesearchaeota archaeon]|nr:MAG: hypothetical protein D6764_01235 [Candidatus Woesearchaeota archaeon]